MEQSDDDRMRWAETLAIERLQGTGAPRWIAERIGRLAAVGDRAGVERFIAIATRHEQLMCRRGAPDA